MKMVLRNRWFFCRPYRRTALRTASKKSNSGNVVHLEKTQSKYPLLGNPSRRLRRYRSPPRPSSLCGRRGDETHLGMPRWSAKGASVITEEESIYFQIIRIYTFYFIPNCSLVLLVAVKYPGLQRRNHILPVNVVDRFC